MTEADVNTALERQFYTLVRTGYFDAPDAQPYRHYGPDKINSKQAQRLSREAAVKSFVLLKNDAQLLPLTLNASRPTRIALIGPNAAATTTLQGSYGRRAAITHSRIRTHCLCSALSIGVYAVAASFAAGQAPYLVSVLSAFQSAASSRSLNVSYAQGCDVSSNDTSGFGEAVALASQADYVLLVMGLNDGIEAEQNDRQSLTYPGVQLQLVQQVAAASVRPVVVLVYGGGQCDTSEWRDSPHVGAYMWTGYAGQEGGAAMLSVLLGDESPSGRLPYTQYPADYVNQIAFTDTNLRPNASSGSPGRTYMFYTGRPVFSFGQGLSYTSFSYQYASAAPAQPFRTEELVAAARAVTADHRRDLPLFRFFSVSLNVTNCGSRFTSDVSVLLFTKPSMPSLPASFPSPPLSQLIDFTHLSALRPGESRLITLSVRLESLSVMTEAGERLLWPGTYSLQVNGGEELPEPFVLQLEGQPQLIRKWPRPPWSTAEQQQ